jgi:hypothetical protein
LVEGLVAEDGEQDVAAASGEADEGGVVFLAFGVFVVVVGAADRVGQGREGGVEEGVFELAVAGSGGMLPVDGGAGSVGEGSDPGVGGEVRRGF